MVGTVLYQRSADQAGRKIGNEKWRVLMMGLRLPLAAGGHKLLEQPELIEMAMEAMNSSTKEDYSSLVDEVLDNVDLHICWQILSFHLNIQDDSPKSRHSVIANFRKSLERELSKLLGPTTTETSIESSKRDLPRKVHFLDTSTPVKSKTIDVAAEEEIPQVFMDAAAGEDLPPQSARVPDDSHAGSSGTTTSATEPTQNKFVQWITSKFKLWTDSPTIPPSRDINEVVQNSVGGTFRSFIDTTTNMTDDDTNQVVQKNSVGGTFRSFIDTTTNMTDDDISDALNITDDDISDALTSHQEEADVPEADVPLETLCAILRDFASYLDDDKVADLTEKMFGDRLEKLAGEEVRLNSKVFKEFFDRVIVHHCDRILFATVLKGADFDFHHFILNHPLRRTSQP